MEPLVIAFSGMIKSGKSALSAELAAKLQWHRVTFGDCVRRIATNQGLDPSDRDLLQQIGAEQIEKDRYGFCQAVIAQAVGWTRNEGLIIDGVRHLEVATELTQIVAPLQLRLVYIDAAEHLRETRIASGGNPVLLRQWDAHSTEIQVPKALRDSADIVIPGETNLNVAALTILEAMTKWLNADGD